MCPPPPPPSLLTFSAAVCAAHRSLEHTAAAPLFTDPVSAALTTSLALSTFPPPPTPAARIAIRTRYFDDALTAALPCGQVVLLGSGMDTRSWRLPDLAASTVYEVDAAEVHAAKAAGLAAGGVASPPARVVPVAADVGAPGWEAALLLAGYDPDAPAIFLAEGVLYYLGGEAVVAATLRTARRLCARGGGVLLASTVGPLSGDADARAARRARAVATFDALVAAGGSDGGTRRVDLAAFFAWGTPDVRSAVGRTGWAVERVDRLGGDRADYGRWGGGASNVMYVTARVAAGGLGGGSAGGG